MYNDNKYSCYTRRCIITTNILLYMKMYFLLYKTMYNYNKYFCYTRRCIITTNILIIHESVFLIIQGDV